MDVATPAVASAAINAGERRGSKSRMGAVALAAVAAVTSVAIASPDPVSDPVPWRRRGRH